MEIKQGIPIQLELSVIRKEYITPHYIRVFLTGNGVEQFICTTVGAHNKIFIPPKGIDKVYFPKLNTDTKQWITPPEEVRPVIRTYTHRGIDIDKKEIWIDFVAHGDEGPASEWAINAQKGSVLGVSMKAKKKKLQQDAENYVLIGDATAIPVLGSILENLPKTAKGTCIIEVHSKEDEQHLQTKADIHIQWLHNSQPQKESRLPEVVKNLILPENNRYVFIAAEFSAVKEIRHYLRNEKKWQRQEFSAVSYWKSGFSEDQSVLERQEDRNNNF
ncbi:siderophore-interacting protein [Sphingobacterium siyangense subsp. cladoniae]|uniref:siderophore-interacting protein n=1 Tax=Sphingobacterium siyangense TaxID=459529 RepID=UPI0031F82075